MATIATLSITLTANSKAFTKGLDRASRRLEKFSRNMVRMGSRLAVAGAAMMMPVVQSVRKFAAYGDQIAKMARRTGISATALAELGYAAEISGASVANLETGIKKMARSITDASSGLVTYERAFVRIGLTSAELVGMAPEQAFAKIAEAIAATEDPMIRAAAAQEIFARAGTMLLPLFDSGASGLAKLSAEYRKLTGLTAEEAVLAEGWTDVLTRVKFAALGLAKSIAVGLGVNVEELSEKIIETTAAMRAWIGRHKGLIQTTVKLGFVLIAVGGAIMSVGLGAKLLVAVIGGLVIAVKVLSAALWVLTAHPLVLVIAAGVALGVILTKLLDKAGLTHSVLETMSDKNKELARAQEEATAAMEGLESQMDMARLAAENAAAGIGDVTGEIAGLSDALKDLDAGDYMRGLAKRAAFPEREYKRALRQAVELQTSIEQIHSRMEQDAKLGITSFGYLVGKRTELLRRLEATNEEIGAFEQVWGDILGLGRDKLLPGLTGMKTDIQAIGGVGRTGALERGTREAYSATIRPMTRSLENYFKKSLTVEQKMLDELEKGNRREAGEAQLTVATF